MHKTRTLRAGLGLITLVVGLAAVAPAAANLTTFTWFYQLTGQPVQNQFHLYFENCPVADFTIPKDAIYANRIGPFAIHYTKTAQPNFEVWKIFVNGCLFDQEQVLKGLTFWNIQFALLGCDLTPVLYRKTAQPTAYLWDFYYGDCLVGTATLPKDVQLGDIDFGLPTFFKVTAQPYKNIWQTYLADCPFPPFEVLKDAVVSEFLGGFVVHYRKIAQPYVDHWQFFANGCLYAEFDVPKNLTFYGTQFGVPVFYRKTAQPYVYHYEVFIGPCLTECFDVPKTLAFNGIDIGCETLVSNLATYNLPPMPHPWADLARQYGQQHDAFLSAAHALTGN
jgi:hypothetical protein